MPRTPLRTCVHPAAASVPIALLILGLLALLPGCTTYVAGQPRQADYLAAAPLPDSDWPPRKTDQLEKLAAETPKQIFSLVSDGAGPIPDNVPPSIRRLAEEPAAKVIYTGIHGPGILRVFDYGKDSWRDASGTMRFVSYTPRTDLPSDPRLTRYAQRQINAWKRRLKDMNCCLKPADTEILQMLSEGTAIRIVEPKGTGPIRGTAIYMSGLGSLQFEQALVDELSERGWWLIRIATPRVWWYESKPWYIGSKDDVPRIAQQLAGVFDDLMAEPAYAAQAALEYIAEHRPEIPQSPLAIVACSAGSLAAPSVVARMPDRFDAAVLIGGGANLLEISQKSDLTDGGIRLSWPDDNPRGDWRKQLFHDYLEYSKLDPYHTARFLRSKPVLLVQANLDLTVPADNGWLLWNQLGKPDRYMHIGEHRTLFLTLHTQSIRIADWLDHAMATRPAHKPVAQGADAATPAAAQPH
jgi:hypothetical protein